MIYTKYRDYRITLLATADQLATAHKRTLLMKCEFADNQHAYYLFGKRIAYKQIAQRKDGSPLHFPKTHFTGVTIDGQKFVYCPAGNICSWSEGDYDHKWCHYCKHWFSEIESSKKIFKELFRFSKRS